MKFYEDLDRALENLSGKGAFLTVKNQDGVVNTMTISWGYVGFSWNRPHFITLIRPQRYTREVIAGADSFTISIPFGDDMKKALALCGSKSGRDVDKAALAGIRFVPAKAVASPVVAGCDLYYECRIRYVDPLHGERLPEDIVESHYKGDFHDLFYGEIVETHRG